MLQGEHTAILLTFIKLPFVIKLFVLSIFEWPFYTGFTVHWKHILYVKMYPFKEKISIKRCFKIASVDFKMSSATFKIFTQRWRLTGFGIYYPENNRISNFIAKYLMHFLFLLLFPPFPIHLPNFPPIKIYPEIIT